MAVLRWACLMEGPGYPIVRCRAELNGDEFIQPLGIWFNPACFFPLIPCRPIARIAHHDHPDAMRASHAADLFDRQLDRSSRSFWICKIT